MILVLFPNTCFKMTLVLYPSHLKRILMLYPSRLFKNDPYDMSTSFRNQHYVIARSVKKRPLCYIQACFWNMILTLYPSKILNASHYFKNDPCAISKSFVFKYDLYVMSKSCFKNDPYGKSNSFLKKDILMIIQVIF